MQIAGGGMNNPLAFLSVWRPRINASKHPSSLHTHHFHMPQLGRHRRVRVYLPPGYTRADRYFSVLYMHDGQNLFHAGEAFARPWQLGRILDKMPLNKQAIVVAIDNGGADRIDEYAPYRRRNRGGQGQAYLQFIVETLKPFIDREYRTLAYPEHTWLVGSSLGGLISFYGGLAYPGTFGKIGVLSPAFWFNPAVLKQAPSASLSANRFYIAGSRTESAGMEHTLQQTYWRLKALGLPDERLTVVVRDRGRHNEAFWSREFRKMYLQMNN